MTDQQGVNETPEDVEIPLHVYDWVHMVAVVRLGDHGWAMADMERVSAATSRACRREARRTTRNLLPAIVDLAADDSPVAINFIRAQFALAGLRAADRIHRKKIANAWKHSPTTGSG